MYLNVTVYSPIPVPFSIVHWLAILTPSIFSIEVETSLFWFPVPVPRVVRFGTQAVSQKVSNMYLEIYSTRSHSVS